MLALISYFHTFAQLLFIFALFIGISLRLILSYFRTDVFLDVSSCV